VSERISGIWVGIEGMWASVGRWNWENGKF
jgi:hypothetical protein